MRCSNLVARCEGEFGSGAGQRELWAFGGQSGFGFGTQYHRRNSIEFRDRAGKASEFVKQVFLSGKGEIEVLDVPVPGRSSNMVLVKSAFSVISTGTEGAAVSRRGG